MDVRLSEGIEILNRTPITLRSLLKGLSDRWVMSNEGPDSWSPFDIVGHLIQGEEFDWIPRARIIIELGETRPFDPFDRHAQFERFKDHTMDELVDLFGFRRAESLESLQSLNVTAEMLDRRGTHPALGTVTLRELFATWVAHDLSHIAQIARVMSRQYTERVGPWKEYLPILTRR